MIKSIAVAKTLKTQNISCKKKAFVYSNFYSVKKISK